MDNASDEQKEANEELGEDVEPVAVFQCADPKHQKFYHIHILGGPPGYPSIRAFDELDQPLPQIKSIEILYDDVSETYQLRVDYERGSLGLHILSAIPWER